MFGLFGLILGAVRAVGAIVSAVVHVVVAAVKQIVRQIAIRTGSYSPMMDLWLNKQINWRRALTSQEEADAEIDRLNDEMGDDDNNGIPDAYDEQVTSPGQDFLGIKYPKVLLKENDYCRLMPRALGSIPQPVALGSKGLVRSETLTNMGQFVMIKWNSLNPPGPVDAPLYRCNAMDLYVLGHVYSSGQLTR